MCKGVKSNKFYFMNYVIIKFFYKLKIFIYFKYNI